MTLISQSILSSPSYEGPAWHRTVLEDLASRLTKPSNFPCTFSINAFSRELIKFIFVEDAGENSLALAAEDLKEYIALCGEWDGRVNSAHPLIMAFSQRAAPTMPLERYHAVGWDVIQYLHDNDEAPWPEDVATDPHSPYWTMCFQGMQLFINMSTPAHCIRKSRNLGEHFLFIVNPRERFDMVAGDNPEGRNIRARIRNRIERYDGISHSEQLGSFQAGEIEWWQYGLTEANAPRRDSCPFRQRMPAAREPSECS